MGKYKKSNLVWNQISDKIKNKQYSRDKLKDNLEMSVQVYGCTNRSAINYSLYANDQCNGFNWIDASGSQLT